jgi:hypothetical protein
LYSITLCDWIDYSRDLLNINQLIVGKHCHKYGLNFQVDGINYSFCYWLRPLVCWGKNHVFEVQNNSSFFCCFFGETGVWTQDFALAKQVLYCLSHSSSPFCSVYFRDEVSPTICLSWPWIMILQISAFHVARITSMSHCHPAE